MSRTDRPTQPSPTLPSAFADDPEMAELIAFFTDELGHRIEGIRQSLGEGDMITLVRQAHQLKGVAGGYGYPTIGDAAARLEAQVKQDEGNQLDSVRAAADELIALCRSASK